MHDFHNTILSLVVTGDEDCPLPLAAVGRISKLWKKKDLLVYFLKPDPQQKQIVDWANEWSKYCAIIFHHSLKQENSDIRVDFENGGMFPA